MRRAVPVLLTLVLALSACAAPEIRLVHRFRPGEVRTYRLVAVASARLRAGAIDRTERTQLEATSRVEVLAAAGGGATLRLSVVPTALRRDGRRAEPLAPQEAVVVVGADGAVRRVESVGGLPAELSGDLEDLGPLLSSPLPAGRLHLGDRWRRSVPGASGRQGRERGRLAALRVVSGYRCAIIALEVRRPIIRSRSFGGTTLRLTGQDFSSIEMSFAFAEGFPVRVASVAVDTLAVSGVAGVGGSVDLRTETVLTLMPRTVPPSRV
ncbi:MAG: hypothetical protein HY775_02195 [Acidobacteria bacterium]|nr:hypothetical protein [Acidobacteriota bacterium]